jgi:hypothetical protein
VSTFQQSIQTTTTTTTEEQQQQELNWKAFTESGDVQCLFWQSELCFWVQIFTMRGEEQHP